MKTIWDTTEAEVSNKLQKKFNEENKKEIHLQTLAILDILKKVGEEIQKNNTVNVRNTIRQVTGKVKVEKPEWFKSFNQTDILKKLDYIASAVIRKEIPKEIRVTRPEWIKELKPKDFPKIEKPKDLTPIIKEVIKAIQEQSDEVTIKNKIEIKKPSWWKVATLDKPILSLASFIKKYFDKAIIKTEVTNKITVANPVKEVKVKNPVDEVTIKNLKKLEENTKLITSQLRALGNTGSSGGKSDTSKLATSAKQDEIIGELEKPTDIAGLGNITIGTTEVKITSGATKELRIRADENNTGIIYIGKTGILSDGTNDFIRLEAGDELMIDYDNTDNPLYAISNTTSQIINVGTII